MNTVWVFGSTGSIGSVLCDAILERGEKVVAFSSSDISNIDIQLRNTPKAGVTVQKFDLSTLDSLDTLVKLSEDPKYAPSHVIFLARGKVPVDSLIDDVTWGEMAIRDLMISLVTPMRIVLKLASKQGTTLKTITLVSSQYAIVSQDPKLYRDPENQISSLYSAIRGGIISGARSLGVLAAKNGIRVNSLILGGVKETAQDDLQSAIENRLPNGKMLSARNACDWLLFLASDQSIGAIGSPIIVDNGWTSI